LKFCFVNQPWTIAAPPVGSDSTGIWSYQIGNRLARRCQVIYYGSYDPSNSPQKLPHDTNLPNQIQYRAISPKIDKFLRIPWKTIDKLGFKSKLPYFGSTWFNFGYGWQIAKDCGRENYDIIHVHNFSQFVPIIRDRLSPNGGNPQAKIVLHLHCEWVNRLQREAIATRLEKADLVISCSDYVTNKIRTRFPEYASKCATVNNGVDADYFVPGDGDYHQHDKTAPQMLFVGRISPEKGIHDLIDAFIKITEKYPQAELTIAGPHIVVEKEFLFDLQHEPEVQALKPFYEHNYLEYIKSKIPDRLASQVTFTGSLPQQELLPYYQKADVVINPSLSEAFGMSLVEAMATQTPVVATNIGGMPEIVDDGVTGRIVEPGNPIAIADAAVEIIDNPEIARVMGKAGRTKVLQRYCWSKIAESLVNRYADIGVKLNLDDTQKTVARSLS
jgi:glycosyltransferase involved in cell wall biosynthesis